MKQVVRGHESSPQENIRAYIDGLGDWRGEVVAQIRKVVQGADPGITEEWQWNTPVWAHRGPVCSAAAFKDHVKLNFFKGAAIKDARGLFNSGFEAKASRSIDFREGDKIDVPGLKGLIRAAVDQNLAAPGGK